MRALDLKLARDLRHMWPQALAIALVMAAGIAVLIVAVGAHQSLSDTREAYYGRYRFADLFASVTRAPKGLIDDIRAIPGIASAEARVAGTGLVTIEGEPRPATARIVSLPANGAPGLNALYLERGRLPDPARTDEIALSAAFAKAHGLDPGSSLPVLIDGAKRW